MKTIPWIQNAVIYQIYPDSFARAEDPEQAGQFEPWNSPETPHGFKGGNLKGAAEKLPYLKELGIDAVYFNPIFASCANHRYHTHDYFNVDPILGGNAAFDVFLQKAHSLGIKVILDGVFNQAFCNRFKKREETYEQSYRKQCFPLFPQFLFQRDRL